MFVFCCYIQTLSWIKDKGQEQHKRTQLWGFPSMETHGRAGKIMTGECKKMNWGRGGWEWGQGRQWSQKGETLEGNWGWRSAHAKQRSWAEHAAYFSLCFKSLALFRTYQYFRWVIPDLSTCIPEDYARAHYFVSKGTETMASRYWMWLLCHLLCLQLPNPDD